MSLSYIRRWFQFNRAEAWWLGGILAIFLLGLIARQLHRPAEPSSSSSSSQKQ
jgi:hypothetical protein